MAAKKTIVVGRNVWQLGDREEVNPGGGVAAIARRPIYYHGKRVGELDPEIAGIVVIALNKTAK